MSELAIKIKHCRLCGSKRLKTVIDLGNSPPPNTLLIKRQLTKRESVFPLKVNYCLSCGQVQLSHVVSPELMFQNYPYVSSTSSVMVNHFKEYAYSTFDKLKLNKNDFVVEIGSNDGVLLKFYKNLGAKILGIDPAKNIVAQANKAGIKTLPLFFNSRLAKKIVEKYGPAKLILANNVFAHINDLNDVVKGVNELLDKDGSFIIEFPYLIDVIDNNVFDSIYHEHLSYLAVSPLKKFFEKNGMEIFNCVKTPVQGGSIRIFIKKQHGKYPISKSVAKFLDLEIKKKIYLVGTYTKFFKKIKETKKDLNSILKTLRKENKRIVGYGAPGRSTTLLNYFGIDSSVIEYIVDDNPNKQGLFTPGSHIPIFDPAKIKKLKPDYIVILSWNFAKPIIAKLSDFKKQGGHFVIPIPKPRII
ncbi:MAG: class I SAM-dependent methyltransferase [Patescibacteria group bacterium]